MTIDRFSGKYRFLSNFYPSPIDYEGLIYPTVEHAFQAAKIAPIDTGTAAILWHMEREKIAGAKTPAKAKQLGQSVKLRRNWDKIRIRIMKEILMIKFSDPKLRKRLLETGDALLVEGNTWGDRFWGVCDGEGENHLGKILMEIRSTVASGDLALRASRPSADRRGRDCVPLVKQ